MQLGHSGRQSSSVLTERPLWAPSNVPCPFNLEMPKEMELEDIDEIVDAHAIGARHAREGGMDGVELQSGYGGYLLASFLSEFSNRRDDEYGGALENRVRILLRANDAIGTVVPNAAANVGLSFNPRTFVTVNARVLNSFSPAAISARCCSVYRPKNPRPFSFSQAEYSDIPEGLNAAPVGSAPSVSLIPG